MFRQVSVLAGCCWHLATVGQTAGTKNAVHLEALGSAGLGSLNYERVLAHTDQITISARAGVGTIRFRNFLHRFDPDLIMPVGVVAYWGQPLAVEFGAGPAFTSIVHPNAEDLAPERKEEVQFWTSAGLRYQKTSGGFLARITYTPIIEFGRLRHWGGVSVGYAF